MSPMMIRNCITILLLLWLRVGSTSAQEMRCCLIAQEPCRSVCSKISLASPTDDSLARENATRAFSQVCPFDLVEFWNCVNSTLREAREQENWSGRACCREARSQLCRASCARVGSRRELGGSCRWSDEARLAECLDRRDEAEQCCASVQDASCRATCRDLLSKSSKRSQALKAYNVKGCFHQVPSCMKPALDQDKSPEDPKTYMHCCEQATRPGCMDVCRRSLHGISSIQEVLDALEERCGPVLPHSPFWSCFLKSSPNKPQKLPLNAAKLACCSKASRAHCQSLCRRAFHSDWSAWQQLDATCLASNLEGELRRCLDDTEDACEIGCSGLSFCSSFNDRPTTLFRTCNAAADESARWEADLWMQGGIISGLGVPVRAASSCPEETLRAAACLLQLRPCESRSHETRLCREDCLELLTRCVDWSAVKGHNAATLCAKLSPLKADMACVSIRPFLEDPREQNELLVPPPTKIEEDINVPCRSNPCPQGQICSVHPEDRRPFRCTAGCSLGEMSKQLVAAGSWVQIPRYEHPSCYRLCHCSTTGKLERCRDLACSTSGLALVQPSSMASGGGSSCWVQGSFVAHRSTFYLDCKPCHCLEGEVTCSRKGCSELRTHQPKLPCDCPNHYVPVCGRLGLTYSSACLAKCSGLLANEVEYNSCSAREPCAANPCRAGEICLRRPRVCLAPIHKPCDQFECVPSLKMCEQRLALDDRFSKGPICDTDHRQHSSMCSLLRSGAKLGYRGPCLRGCSLRGPVCGVNGETYASECAAWAERVALDYSGPCVAVGLVSDLPAPRCGSAVACPPLARQRCVGVTPPGACCPVCAGAARLFYSKKQLDRIYYELTDESDKRVVTLEAMIDGLSRQLGVAECSLRASITPEGDIFLVNQAVSKSPSELQLSACVVEIEKLVSRVAERSPRIVLEVPLSALTRAEVAHSRIVSAANSAEAVASSRSVEMLCVAIVAFRLAIFRLA
ncbi:hypothetical protein TKK_0007276 [Trichogramma kaykai]|uniref:Kazal-like domain-containing protein n=1 Tax=Trichogramma kaykai TaxID=54128 RepID=A0ABD2XAN6_9HYME